MIKRLIKNSSYLIFAQIIVKSVSFFYTLFLARELGVSNFGLYTLALSYFALISAFSDFGVSNYLIRQVSSKNKSVSELLLNVLITRLLFASIVLILFSLFLVFFDPLRTRVELVLIVMVALFPQILALTIDSIFIGIQKLSYSAMGVALLNILTSILGFLLISSGYGTYGAIAAFTGAQFFYALFMLVLLLLKTNYFSKVDTTFIKEIVKESLPYGFLGVLGILYFKVDTILLSYIKGSYDTGIYAAAYKFLEAVVFIPSAVSISLFPAFANLSTEEPKKVYKLYKDSLLILLAVSLVVMFLFLLVLPMVIETFLPKYRLSIEVVRILSLTIPFFFMISAQSAVLLSQKRFLKGLIIASIFNLLFNLVLNLIFIPKYSFIASAWITFLSDFVGFWIFFVLIRRYLRF